MTTLSDLVKLVKSKNAGPFELTFDLFFDDESQYRTVIESGILTEARIADTYNIPESEVLGVFHLDGIQAIKVSMRRPIPAGSVNDTDLVGAQQHVPLLDIEAE